MKNVSKSEILDNCLSTVTLRYKALQDDLKSIQNDIASETKSSAGDKYETSREMMNQEKNKLMDQIAQLKVQENALKKIDPKSRYNKVQFGALITTNKGLYFMSVPLGKINVEDLSVFVISMNSPIGKAMSGLKKNADFKWQSDTIKITDLY